MSGAARVTAVGIGLVAFATFSPSLWYEFLDWDDLANLVFNHAYRGLDWSHLHWMLTTVHGGHWIPLTWLTFGIDYVVWGMNPFGYHLTNVLLHAANAMAVFFLARRLLRVARPQSPQSVLDVGAATGALFFALHPLRVESVAWITERRDVLSALFWLLAIIAYLRALERTGTAGGRWKVVSLGCYQLAVLAKSMAVTLPAVLLLLDLYPLQRRAQGGRRLLLEKVPYLPMTLFGAAMAIYAIRITGFSTSIDHLPLLSRIAVVAYSIGFYVSATLAPIALSPLHELPPSMSIFEPRFMLSIVAVAAVTVLLVVLRRRWPAGLTCWSAYLIIMAPVSGVLHNGPQLVADRYSYLSCLPWAILLGGVVSALCERLASRSVPLLLYRVSAALSVLVLAALPLLTWRQLPVWRDSDTLWRHTLAVDPDCSVCHYNFGQYLRNGGKPHLAVGEFSRAAELRPSLRHVAVYRANRGLAYLELGSVAIANQELAALQIASPQFAEQVRPAFIVDW